MGGSAENREISRARVCLDPQALGNHKMLSQKIDEVRILLSKDSLQLRKGNGLAREVEEREHEVAALG